MRIKKSIQPVINSRDAAESVMNQLALLLNNKRSCQARLDAELLALKEKYETPLSLYEADIKTFTADLQAWAAANPAEFPKDRKSLKLTAGTLGFRTGTPKLSLVSRAFNWTKVLAAFLTDAEVSDYVRRVPEIDKERILAEYGCAESKTSFEIVLKAHGVKVEQEETFFIEPDLTPFQKRVTEPKTSTTN